MKALLISTSLRLLVIPPIFLGVQPKGSLRAAALIFGLLNVCSAIESDQWKRVRSLPRATRRQSVRVGER